MVFDAGKKSYVHSEVGTRSERCHLNKEHLQQTYSQHYIYSERVNVFPLRLRTRQGCPQC